MKTATIENFYDLPVTVREYFAKLHHITLLGHATLEIADNGATRWTFRVYGLQAVVVHLLREGLFTMTGFDGETYSLVPTRFFPAFTTPEYDSEMLKEWSAA